MKILFLTNILLSKNRNGGEVASQCFIDGLRELGHQVTVVGYQRRGDHFEHDPQDTLVVEERYTETRKSKFFAILWLSFSFWKNLPYSSAKYYSRSYINLVKKLLQSQKYDVFVIDHAQIGWIEPYINQPKLITISHNIEHEIYEKQAKNSPKLVSELIYQREANLVKLQEEDLLNSVKQVWTLTEHDNKYFSQCGGLNKTKTFGIVPGFTKIQETFINKSFDIGILGSWTWKANIEALEWFLQAVYPHLSPNYSIHVAGKGADWLRDKYPNINYRGVVSDAQEFMAQAKAIAIPTLSGGGIQIKTLDAIASGSPIVATPVAMRGIINPPSTVKVTPHPQKFAQLLALRVETSSSPEIADDAKKWYRIRQKEFLNDLANAMEDMLLPEESLV